MNKNTPGPWEGYNNKCPECGVLAALKEYQKANRLHHDEDARLYDLAAAAIAKAEGEEA